MRFSSQQIFTPSRLRVITRGLLLALVLLPFLLPRGLQAVGCCAVQPPSAASGAPATRAWGEERLTLAVGQRVFRPTRAQLGWSGPQLRDAVVLEHYLEALRGEIDRLPVTGSFAPDGSAIDGLPGEALDTVALRHAIERALARSETQLRLDTIVTPAPRVFQRYASAAADLHQLMAEQETSFRRGTGRALNIELAARKLDGALLPPGAALSFNEKVGKRELARGFAPALELVRGELIDGVGGGVCQVAGTLHAAAFFAGLAVEEYHAHSRLSRLAYLQPGLDAMVAWPDDARELRDTKDLRLRNPYPFPVALEVKSERGTDRDVLRVRLFGAARPFHVDFAFKLLGRVAAREIRRPDPVLALGDVRVQQEAFDGVRIARRRTVFKPLRRIDEETLIEYPPVPRIVRFGTALAAAK